MLGDSTCYPITPENLLLRGSSLKNTDCIFGVVVYVGHETKIMKNGAVSKIKMSKNERMLNRQIVYIFLLQLALCIFASVYGTIWEKNNKQREK